MNRFSRNEAQLTAQAEDLMLPEVAQLSAESEESLNEASQRFVAFCRAVGGLPEECRRVMILKKVYGLSLADIAAHLNTTQAMVEKDLARGLMMCREYLENASRPQPGSGPRQANQDK
jgi:RNA polymerase sigma-70 factor (ECF subfamily)